MKTLRIQIVVQDDSISIETPSLTEDNDFYFSALFHNGVITGYGMQANNENPEWPELRKKLATVAREALAAHKIYNGV